MVQVMGIETTKTVFKESLVHYQTSASLIPDHKNIHSIPHEHKSGTVQSPNNQISLAYPLCSSACCATEIMLC